MRGVQRAAATPSAFSPRVFLCRLPCFIHPSIHPVKARHVEGVHAASPSPTRRCRCRGSRAREGPQASGRVLTLQRADRLLCPLEVAHARMHAPPPPTSLPPPPWPGLQASTCLTSRGRAARRCWAWSTTPSCRAACPSRPSRVSVSQQAGGIAVSMQAYLPFHWVRQLANAICSASASQLCMLCCAAPQRLTRCCRVPTQQCCSLTHMWHLLRHLSGR